MKRINIGFLCPDDEWRSKLCQFVYEELTTIFDFNEDLAKLHSFIKTASWNLPIALFTHNSINIVNTVCSIASYYGVGLEVLRTDISQTRQRIQEGYFWNREIRENIGTQNSKDQETPLSREAAVLHSHLSNIDPTKLSMGEQQLLFEQMHCKDDMIIEEKQQVQQT